MSATFVLLKKSIALFARNRAAVILTFVVPGMLVALMGFVFGLYGHRESGPSGIPLGIANLSDNPGAAKLVEALRAEKTFDVRVQEKLPTGSRGFSEATLREKIHAGDFRYGLVIPEDLISTEHMGIHLKFLTDPRNDIESQMVVGLLQKVIFTKVPQLLSASLRQQAERHIGATGLKEFHHSIAELVANRFGGNAAEIERRIDEGDLGLGAFNESPAASPAQNSGKTEAKEDETTFLSRIFKFDTEQLTGKNLSNPMGARLVGGYAIMFLLFAVSGSAIAMFEEKRTGIFQRILAAPVTRAQIVWSRFLFGVLLGVIQIGALFFAGHVLFHLNLLPHLGALLVLTVCASAACTAFGMLLASLAPGPEAVQGLSTLLIMAMSAIGGAWMPVSFLPVFIQKFSKLTIVYWSVEGFTSIIWAGQSLRDVLPNIAALASMAIGVMAVAIWSFRRGKMFD